MKEIFKPIIFKGVNYKGQYEVSNLGRIKNTKTGNLLNHRTTHRTKSYMSLCIGGRRTTAPIHVLVWEAFNGKLQKWHRIEHKDKDSFNNGLNNLYLSHTRKLSVKDNEFPPGVSLTSNGQKYMSQISITNSCNQCRTVYLGYYFDKEQASTAYKIILRFLRNKENPTQKQVRDRINKYREQLNIKLLPVKGKPKKDLKPKRFTHIPLSELF